jgi:hypothetical protein
LLPGGNVFGVQVNGELVRRDRVAVELRGKLVIERGDQLAGQLILAVASSKKPGTGFDDGLKPAFEMIKWRTHTV